MSVARRFEKLGQTGHASPIVKLVVHFPPKEAATVIKSTPNGGSLQKSSVVMSTPSGWAWREFRDRSDYIRSEFQKFRNSVSLW